ncbi:MAG TPA: hypothetical protein VFQ61_04580 [Polyangiaceae bacterium]|nr:hypothetical protein [Polyangiaceae bacterium]
MKLTPVARLMRVSARSTLTLLALTSSAPGAPESLGGADQAPPQSNASDQPEREQHSRPRLASSVRGEIEADNERFDGDGVYGRFDGDVNLALGVGAEVSEVARATAVGRVLYYSSVGVFAAYSDAMDATAHVRRTAAIGLELRPLFLLRWSNDLEWGCAMCDLTLDSLSLGLAGVWTQPGDRRPSGGEEPLALAGPARWALEWSLSAGIPLFARAQGLWLEGKVFARPGLGDDAVGGALLLSYYAALLSPWVR